MAIEIFDAVIYLPIIVIGQIYFEHYFASFKNQRSANFILTTVIVVTYLIQEFCLLQISLLNIRDAAFIMVLPVTMLFRNSRNKIWWWLLAITPILANIYMAHIKLSSFSDWGVWIGQSIVFFLVCLALTSRKYLSLRVRYTMAIVGLGIVELLYLTLENQFRPASIVAATAGLGVFLILEGQRYAVEMKKDQKLKLLQNESERDDLTGLLNYRALSQEIKNLTKRKEIHNIIIGGLDIDHFKSINDRYGHFVGNEVLNRFSTTLRDRIHSEFPNHGYAYRFGGEEFSIVVTNHSISEVHAVLQSVERYFVQHPIITTEGGPNQSQFLCWLN
ncbi:MAG: diguanylate cyclase [Lactobacillaceae bacterium]|uniref:GGDEF domain-containing protein n=1 Tax=Limosilactobacillus sp. TaxID=2773925 RepID=UPI002A7605E2|nr:diguanylate cyclase [Limosilactobacillus sp.]MDD7693408.1 diguanylate cyclase [Lactobacillaceae bacterium]MDY2802376.1 diguanylate cyclase [Limosilactobacillus sp.]